MRVFKFAKSKCYVFEQNTTKQTFFIYKKVERKRKGITTFNRN